MKWVAVTGIPACGKCSYSITSSAFARSKGGTMRPSALPRSLVPVDVFYERKKAGTGKQPSEDFESAHWPRSLGEPVGSDQPSAKRQRSSSLTRISILIIAVDSRTIHSEYVGKTTGPEAMLAANCLVGHLGRGSKRPNKLRGYIFAYFLGKYLKI
jgi:hypothetical protein